MMVHPILCLDLGDVPGQRSEQAFANAGNPGSHIGPGLMPKQPACINYLCVLKQIHDYGSWMAAIWPLLLSLRVGDNVGDMSQIQ